MKLRLRYWFIAAMALRLALLLRPDALWYDETFSVLVARLPWARLLAATAGDVHPPLYYALLKLWLIPWPGAWFEIAARSFSVVCAGVALWLWFLILKRMDDIPENEKRIAFVLACFMPGIVYFSIEARMYALLAVFVLAAWYCFLCERPLLAGLFLGLGALTHNAGLLYAVAIALALLHYRRAWVTFWMTVAAAGVVVVMYAPWAATVIRQLDATQAGYWTWLPTLGTVAYMQFRAVMFMNNIPDVLDSVLMMLIASLTTFGMWAARRSAAIIAVLFIAVAVVVSYASGVGVLLHRALIPAAFFICIAWARLLARRDVGVALGSLCALAFVYANASYLLNGRIGADYNVLNDIAARPGDIILAANFSAVPLSLYTDTPVVVSDVALSGGMGTGLSAQTVAALGFTVADPASLDWTRAWLIYVESPRADTATERAYIDGLVARYDGAQVSDGWADNVEGGLWLLER